MDIWEYFKGLFKKSEESSPAQPFLRESIVRSEAHQNSYELWKRTRAKDKMLDYINQQYANSIIEPDALDTGIDILNTPSSKGFVLHFSEMRDNENDFLFLFDYLKERVLELKYTSYMSDERTYNRTNWVETVQRHYLKPSLKLLHLEQINERPLHQLYGNILIELLYRNDALYNLKFRANSYNDHKFEVAAKFSDLIRAITQK